MACSLEYCTWYCLALDYLHSTSSPPVAHNNLKAANVFLDNEFMPRLCDSGLAASELAISYLGYSTPDNGPGRVDNPKGDIFAFGYKNKKGTVSGEMGIVSYAQEDLVEMVDSRIVCDLSSKVLSQFADIVTLCIQSQILFVDHRHHQKQTNNGRLKNRTQLSSFTQLVNKSFFTSQTASTLQSLPESSPTYRVCQD
ncbi:hypothetical protein C5167_045932 [Papaver somniferum]|uniref:Protein kinase domain-containing protein n=1 Tax=Papaver somniferum TaxID=3469 RepID=A0A4Y7LCD8_PAPSO|nr:hypothetical protein C5167_045932 [Papaver somniferum]